MCVVGGSPLDWPQHHNCVNCVCALANNGYRCILAAYMYMQSELKYVQQQLGVAGGKWIPTLHISLWHVIGLPSLYSSIE